MRAKFIYEKFIADSDPIRDMGIGIFTPHTFNTSSAAAKFVVQALPAILDTKEIPNDIVMLDGSYIQWNDKYMEKVVNYVTKYIFITKGEAYMWDIFHFMYKVLKRKGFPKIIN